MTIHFHSHRQQEFEILMKRGSTPWSRLATIKDNFVPTSEGLPLESYEDRGREEDEVVTDMPFARPSSFLFLRYAWPVNCVLLSLSPSRLLVFSAVYWSYNIGSLE